MTISILIDNLSPAGTSPLKAEHGFAAYIVTDGGKRILCDTGASEAFIGNAETMGISLQDTDFAMISHGHADHTGGLEAFAKRFTEVPVYLATEIAGQRYFSNRARTSAAIAEAETSPMRDISTAFSAIGSIGKLNFVDGSVFVTDEVAIVAAKDYGYSKPRGNSHLYTAPRDGGQESEAAFRKDDFAHERALTIKTAEGLVIVSPCSHMGAMNIIKSCVDFTGEKKVLAFIGGLHLVDSPTAIHQQYNDTETTTAIHQHLNPTPPAASETHKLIKEIASEYPDIQIYTGHCTGQDAKKILTSENIGKVRTIIFNTGSTISFD